MNTIEVEDLEAAIAKVTAAGGTAVSEAIEVPGVGTWASMLDPGGVRFGMIQPTPHDHPH